MTSHSRRRNHRALRALLLAAGLYAVNTAASPELTELSSTIPAMLNEPFLQLPGDDSVRVVWMTNFPGIRNMIVCGEGRSRQRVYAVSEKMDRMLEDASSTAAGLSGVEITAVVRRPVYRHEAICSGLEPGKRVPYSVVSIAADRSIHEAGPYTLQPKPPAGAPMKILLTSDQQNRQMSPAGYQKAEETAGPFDLVLVSGDYVDNPRKASEWFDRYDPSWLSTPGEPGQPAFPRARPPFFPAMQGTFQTLFPEFPYRGGEILQHAPVVGAIGNHEIPGRFRPNEPVIVNGDARLADLGFMDNDPQPRWYARLQYEQQQDAINPTGDPALRERWIRDNSQDFDVHREMWTHPEGPQGESYYSFSYGDVYVIVMNVSRIWRTWNVRPQDRGKFTEFASESNNPAEWGFGDFHYERFDETSEQYRWLEAVLASDEYQSAKYKVVLAHHTVFGLGDNAVPVHTVPLMVLEYEDAIAGVQTKTIAYPDDYAQRAEVFKAEVAPLLGTVREVRYEYPLSKDIWRNTIEPLLLDNGVQLVHVGHSHLWNRAKVGSLNYIETSNYGNSFGAYWTQPDGTPYLDRGRTAWASSFWGELATPESRWDPANYPSVDDPHGREPIYPNLANPMQLFEATPAPVPFVSSNNVTVFSYIDTGMGMVRSFAFDTRNPDGDVLEFDRFPLLDN